MEFAGRSLRAVLVAALVGLLLLPTTALGTVNITHKVVPTAAERNAADPKLSGDNIGFDGAWYWGPYDIYPAIDVKNIDSGTTLWSAGGPAVEISDFEGDWIAYTDGMASERAYIYNLATGVQWDLADPYVYSISSVQIEGNRAVWLESFSSESTLRSIDLSTGQISTETVLPSSYGIAFEGDAVITATTQMGANDLVAYNLSTKNLSTFVAEEGVQEYPCIENGMVCWLDQRDDWSVRIKPLAGGDEKVLGTGADQSTWPSIGERFVTWAKGPWPTSDVYAHDLATGITFPVAERPGRQGSPDTEGGRVAYVEASIDATHVDLSVDDVVIVEPSLDRLKMPKSLKVNRDGKFETAITNADSGDIETVKWSWGDGTSTEATVTGSTRVSARHAYATKGDFSGKLTVTDASGIAKSLSFVMPVR